jgi:hypothetical protein
MARRARSSLHDLQFGFEVAAPALRIETAGDRGLDQADSRLQPSQRFVERHRHRDPSSPFRPD